MASQREQKIRERAYRIWEDEGQPEGRDHAHWAQAEQEHGDGLIADLAKDLPFGEPSDTGTADQTIDRDDHPQTIAAEPSGATSDSGTSSPAATSGTASKNSSDRVATASRAVEPPAVAPAGKKPRRGKAGSKTTN